MNSIRITGANQNNLKGFDLAIPLNRLTVITGVSGSGKSSLAFDTIYAEGQRRYVETFSSYARQFLDRMDKPKVDRIEGIPPAIAIDQTNPVRTSRSTVGTMTELNDHLKLLYARAAKLYCRSCGQKVKPDTPETIYTDLKKQLSGARVLMVFPVPVPDNFSTDEILALLARQGYSRIHRQEESLVEVIHDRIIIAAPNKSRIVEAVEACFRHGKNRLVVYPDTGSGGALRYSADLHCAHCDISYTSPTPNFFSFNSAIGACETCRGFGRTIGVDYGLVVPDENKSLLHGAVKPFQSGSYKECQDDLIRFARKKGVPVSVPWKTLKAVHKSWVLEGEGNWENKVWYGVKRFFEWMESRSYKMHVRVFLSRYRAYHECHACSGARLKPEPLLWRIGGSRGYSMHDLTKLPIDETAQFIDRFSRELTLDAAAEVVFGEIRTRLAYLVDVGLGYLTLDRQSRTLSGGEVQRINLTTALGTSLVNTLFILDEPSIGLHPRDISRLAEILRRLRDAGNTLIVVEHDPDLIRIADTIVDMGPGPGERGGTVVYSGTFKGLSGCASSPTAEYFFGKKQPRLLTGTAPVAAGPWLTITGAREHNLKSIDVRIPLGTLTCVTGVSGSGKSTLVNDILYRALCKHFGHPSDSPGKYGTLKGLKFLDDAVMVDQTALGRTSRGNPASYVGAFGTIRTLFARQKDARERGYTPGTFSFNSGTGRCPTCNGSGFEHVEMQFLSDVYLRCPDCDGKRYRNETLDVKIRIEQGPNAGTELSIANVLDLTVTEAITVFAGQKQTVAALTPLAEVGLGYIRLGQPLPTLSGGEAQRLKLAGHLAGKHTGRTLFLFDEPTTGLHFSDTVVLMNALRRLVSTGHSVVVIEHNLDVISGADWILDLGPEGGGKGGHLVCEGTVETVQACQTSYTGQALAAYHHTAQRPSLRLREKRATLPPVPRATIELVHAREHNLKNITLSIPRDAFTVITGVSGSGKSTVAFDILFAEGQRRYLESINAYARQFVQPASRPDIDSITGLPPAVAIEQRTSRGGRKSTVATVTEVYYFLRLLFVKLGTQYCPECSVPIQPQTLEQMVARIVAEWSGKKIDLFAPLVSSRKGLYNDLAAWALARGYERLRVDGTLLPTAAWPHLDRFHEHSIELPLGSVSVDVKQERKLRELLETGLVHGKQRVIVLVESGGKKVGQQEHLFSTTRSCTECGRSFDEPDPRMFSYNSRHGWCPACFGTGLHLEGFDAEQTGEEIWWNAWFDGDAKVCHDCHGKRLKPDSLAVFLDQRSIADMTAMSVDDALGYFAALSWNGRNAEIGNGLLAELCSRLTFLQEVGLGYLTLDRGAPTLSGGEAQRIRLAAQLGSNLRGVCYILDEPTIGLHSRDNAMLLDTLDNLRKKGNTVVVVEHDEQTIRCADHILDLGPGGGVLGGTVIAEGNAKALMRNPRSITGACLRTPMPHPAQPRRPVARTGARIIVRKAFLHNLKKITAAFPLGRLIAVTGVSGSGKSTLVRNILHDNLAAQLSQKGKKRGLPGNRFAGCESIEGFAPIGRVTEVDQRSIGRTPRSCPATYVGIWDQIRKLFASAPESALRGYTASRFSFNVAQGRCPACDGQGMKKIEMSFLPDVTVGCEVCGGLRFNPETLEVRFKERTIGEVLNMSIDDAAEFFSAHAGIFHTLSLLRDVGLGYVRLGQQSPTLSGGEAQRIKLVTELARVKPSLRPRRGATTDAALYVLDEPTIGLHMDDVRKLITVLHRLVDAGNTVVIIEHNLDIIAEADWVLDLGPEGGNGGGRIVAKGSPETVAAKANGSHTARYLKPFLDTRKQDKPQFCERDTKTRAR